MKGRTKESNLLVIFLNLPSLKNYFNHGLSWLIKPLQIQYGYKTLPGDVKHVQSFIYVERKLKNFVFTGAHSLEVLEKKY